MLNDRTDYRYVGGDLTATDDQGNSLVQIDGGILPLRTGTTYNGTDARRVLRGEDLCFLYEAAHRRLNAVGGVYSYSLNAAGTNVWTREFNRSGCVRLNWTWPFSRRVGHDQMWSAVRCEGMDGGSYGTAFVGVAPQVLRLAQGGANPLNNQFLHQNLLSAPGAETEVVSDVHDYSHSVFYDALAANGKIPTCDAAALPGVDDIWRALRFDSMCALFDLMRGTHAYFPLMPTLGRSRLVTASFTEYHGPGVTPPAPPDAKITDVEWGPEWRYEYEAYNSAGDRNGHGSAYYRVPEARRVRMMMNGSYPPASSTFWGVFDVAWGGSGTYAADFGSGRRHVVMDLSAWTTGGAVLELPADGKAFVDEMARRVGVTLPALSSAFRGDLSSWTFDIALNDLYFVFSVDPAIVFDPATP